MNATGERLAFSKKRVRCPACDSGRGFAPLNGAPGAGKCFACGEFLPPNQKPDYANEGILKKRDGTALNLSVAMVPKDDEREVPSKDVVPTLLPLIRRLKREECFDRPGIYECDEYDELAAKYHECNGLSLEESETQAAKSMGWIDDNQNNPMLQKIPEELTLLRRENPFFETITQLTRPTILSEWHVGLSSDGAVLFWYVDRNNRFRNAKKVWFGPDGFHRSDTRTPYFLYTKKDGFSAPLYGEWQLSSRETETVVLVESEKTAIVLACYMPGFVVLATGGSEFLKERPARTLRGRNVNILFDRDYAGTKGAERTSAILTKIGAHPKIINPYELWSDAPDGYDGADAIYDEIILGIKHGQVLNGSAGN